MTETLQKAKKWVPLFFYDREPQQNTLSIVEELVRPLLHLLVYLPLHLIFVVILVLGSATFAGTFWETSAGNVALWIVATATIFVPFRRSFCPSYFKIVLMYLRSVEPLIPEYFSVNKI